MRSAESEPRGGKLASALGAAVDSLARERSPDGMWRDFQTLAGPSSEWVTGFVTYALAQTAGADALVQSGARELVRRQRPDGGWGYNGITPSDADSTAWALLALAAAGHAPAAAKRGQRYLLEHQTPVGGFSTYTLSDGIAMFIGAADPIQVQGWLTPQACVTAAAVQALVSHGGQPANPALHAAAGFLSETRDRTGIWHTTWWCGSEYPTFQALRALMLVHAAAPALVTTAARALVRGQRPDGRWGNADDAISSAFATAFGLLALALVPAPGHAAAVARAVGWLLAHQRSDGSWEPATILRIPSPLRVHPGRGTGAVIADDQGIFTTAAAAWALAAARAQDVTVSASGSR